MSSSTNSAARVSSVRVTDARETISFTERYQESTYRDGLDGGVMSIAVEVPINTSLDHLFSLFVALAAETHRQMTHRGDTVLEQLINTDVGITNGLTKFLGRGHSFQVRILRSDPPEPSLVFKSVLPYADFTRQEEKERLQNVILELRALTHTPLQRHPNIVDLLGLGWESDSVDETRKWPVLILEYADGGTLSDFLRRHPDLSYAQRLALSSDVANGLSALHRCGIVHGDLKPDNVLVFRSHTTRDNFEWIAKLADFGGSILDVEKNSCGLLAMGTHPWNAPEWEDLLTREGLLKTDVYSLGLLIWSIMASGIDPIVFDLHLFGIASETLDVKQLRRAVEQLKNCGDEQILGGLMAAGHERFASGVDLNDIESILRYSVQRDSSVRDLNAVCKSLHEASTRRQEIDEKSDIEQELLSDFVPQPIITMNHMENIFMSADDIDTTDPTIQHYIIQRLLYTFQHNTNNEHRGAAALTLAIAALRQSEDPSSTRDCCKWLARSAQCGNQTSQSLVYRFHVALQETLPESIVGSVKGWIIDAAQRNYPHAQQDLAMLTTPEERISIWRKVRSRFAGMGWNRFASLYPSPDVDYDAWDAALCGQIVLKLQDSEFDFSSYTFNKEGDNILHFASSAGLGTVVRLWSQPVPIDINTRGVDGETALLHACRSGHFSVVVSLLDYGADPRIPNSNGDTPLHWIVAFTGDEADGVAKRLVQAGANPNAAAKNIRYEFAPLCDYLAGTPLHRAVCRGNLDAVKALLAVGASVVDSGARADGLSPLYFAAQLYHPDILKVLLQSLGDPMSAARTYSDMLLLIPAIVGDKLYGGKFTMIARHGAQWKEKMQNTLDVLLQHGASEHLHGFPESVMAAGCTALFAATASGIPDTVQYLLEHGCETDVDVPSGLYPSATRYTPLYQAIFGRRKETFDVLLRHNANVHLLNEDENGDQLTYLFHCAAAGHSNASYADELVRSGVGVDAGPEGYESPFACAVRNRCFTLATRLLELGADPHREYRKGLLLEARFSSSLLAFLVKEQARSTLVSIDFLLRMVPDVNFIVRSVHRHTVLHELASVPFPGRDEEACDIIADTLIKHFNPSAADVNVQNVRGQTALYLASAHNNPRLIKRLVSLGGDPLIEDMDGSSAVIVNEVFLKALVDEPENYIDGLDPTPATRQIRAALQSRQQIRAILEPGHHI